MNKGKIVTAVGAVIALIGLLILVYAILPAEDTMEFTIPSGEYYYYTSYGGLIGGSIEMDFVVADGAVRVYVFDQDEYDSYSSTGLGDYVFTTSGDSGSFNYVLPDTGIYYFVFEHGSLSGSISQEVTVTTTVNGIALLGTILGVVLVVVGIAIALFGRRMTARELKNAPPSSAPTDVTFFQGQQQNPPGNE